ncbi:response regulator transcription factor [Cohnella sp. GCM10012308]|uniref:response regulator transcription factor n=1 Tax=Cohnella sp. GCM10012308 TaxID=3317329 RepID=UPI003616986B
MEKLVAREEKTAVRGTILLVDDEKEIIKLMEIYFVNEGYSLLRASDGLEALDLLERHPVDLIIMDVMMPRMDGIEACMRIRETRELPIILLSAKSQDIDKIAGLSIGADDYVAKPFNPLELIARAKSQLRRYKQFGRSGVRDEAQIEIDDLVINTATHKVTADGEEIKLTPREFAILRLLAVNRGIVLSMDKIYQEVWNEPFMESKNTVMVHIRKLREKIEKDPQAPRYIKTVWGIGYKIDPNG